MTRYQTNSIWETFYIITNQYSLKYQGHERQEKNEEMSNTGRPKRHNSQIFVGPLPASWNRKKTLRQKTGKT